MQKHKVLWPARPIVQARTSKCAQVKRAMQRLLDARDGLDSTLYGSSFEPEGVRVGQQRMGGVKCRQRAGNEAVPHT